MFLIKRNYFRVIIAKNDYVGPSERKHASGIRLSGSSKCQMKKSTSLFIVTWVVIANYWTG